MITLEIDNSVCRVKGLSPQQDRAMREAMSYEMNASAAFFSGAGVYRKRSLFDKRGTFPTGLLYVALETLPPGVQVVDKRRRPISAQRLFTLRLEFTPYPQQGEAAKAAIRHSRGIISAVTGSGKSLIAALIVNELQVRTLIVVPSLELKTQLTESMQEWFGVSKVGKGRDIWIENVQALPATPLVGYDCVIIDEYHHSAAKTYRTLNLKSWGGVFYRFGLSATPFRSKDEERLLLESVLSQVIYRLDYRTAAKYGYIVPIDAYYVESPKQDTDAHTWQQVYSELVVKNQLRNSLIAHLLETLVSFENSTLCLVKEIAHGEILAEMTGLPFVHGQDEESRRYVQQFNSGKIKALIGTTGVIGEGVDTKPCEYVIIAGLGKAKSAFMQQVGRALRTFPGKESGKVIIIKDRSHKYCLRHFNEQAKILKTEYGCQPVKL